MQTVLRVALFYVLILVGIRIIGKREFSQLSPFELVTLLLIPELVQQALVREDFSATNGVIAISTLLTLVYLTSVVVQHSRKAEELIEGMPAVLVYNGRFVPDTMAHERVTPGEVFTQMRQAGLLRLEQVKWALLEPDGRISVVPADPADKQIKPRPETV